MDEFLAQVMQAMRDEWNAKLSAFGEGLDLKEYIGVPRGTVYACNHTVHNECISGEC